MSPGMPRPGIMLRTTRTGHAGSGGGRRSGHCLPAVRLRRPEERIRHPQVPDRILQRVRYGCTVADGRGKEVPLDRVLIADIELDGLALDDLAPTSPSFDDDSGRPI